MFNKLKQYKELRDQAKKIQNGLAEEHVTLENHGINLTMNGNMEVELIKLNPGLDIESQEKYLRELLNNATKKVQRVMAEKMKNMGGLGNFNIPGM
ncbi:MAG: YbaB/EbfC family nucleoid-associated protein [Patescibacteria group bacterium]|nr:YbaB/EbfC family nucleoid-associated protein [Patescibacteria group bacterium]MDD5490540.1 YbaB/EbfC family nucleoid-associated protein [Patescibacteria group bacterium]